VALLIGDCASADGTEKSKDGDGERERKGEKRKEAKREKRGAKIMLSCKEEKEKEPDLGKTRGLA
jgi:hypothetical protein